MAHLLALCLCPILLLHGGLTHSALRGNCLLL